MKLEEFVATHDDEVVATAKTQQDLKKKLHSVEVNNLFPTFKIFQLTIKQIDRVYIPKG